MNAKAPQAAAEVRVLKTATCSSVSGKSRISYDVGCTPDAEIHLRITANTGTGAFSQDWVSLRGIRQALASAPAPGEITSFHLHTLYAGRSVNTPPFLLAALVSEGLVRPSKSKRRCYECADDAAFLAAIKVWKATGDGDGVRESRKSGSKARPRTKMEQRDEARKAALSDTKQSGSLDVTEGSPLATRKGIPSSTTVKRLPKTKKTAPGKIKAKRLR